ncbi:hypothetical protein EIP86_009514 [Pleurotus ostreatoroseus]|nr:hypothetical protein EIP86_009514 [Pleurotus ostreatoroseus]
MILVASTSKPFAYTAKGTARRQAVINEYDEEIEAMYSSAESTSSKVEPPVSWDETNTKGFIRDVVATVLKRHVDESADIFRFGCDRSDLILRCTTNNTNTAHVPSLQATWIRNQIIHALRATVGDRSESLPPNCIYQAPTIAELTKLVLLAAGTLQNGHAEDSKPRSQVLRDIVLQYTSTFPARPNELLGSHPSRDVVLLTGTTGGLGAHILFHLLRQSNVDRVYALNRTSASMKQQRDTFRRNGLEDSVLDSPKLRFLIGDLSQPSFGLDLSVYEEVDFNQGLNSYEPLLVGVRKLVEFALSSPYSRAPSILFTGSMGVFRELPEIIPALEEPITDPSICIGPGYSESKWIAEEVLLAARAKAGLSTVIARLGQVCGGYNGYWNEREWFPAIVKSALHVKCLPSLEGDVDIAWVPAYEAALVMTQLRDSNEPVVHIAHPKPTTWATILNTVATDLKVDLVSYTTWLSALEEAYPPGDTPDAEKLRENPALRLIDHFRTIEVGYGREPLGGVKMDVSKALKEAPALDMPQMTSEWAHKWMAAWRACRFLPPQAT